MYTPRKNQGQIVDVSYGWHDGSLYRRTIDRSDKSMEWAVADDRSARKEAESEVGLWDRAPEVRSWRPCVEPSDED